MISRETLLKMEFRLEEDHKYQIKAHSVFLCHFFTDITVPNKITRLLEGKHTVEDFLVAKKMQLPYRDEPSLVTLVQAANAFRLAWVRKMLDGASIEDAFHQTVKEFKP